ncbi:MAG: type IV pilus modification protein PilV [Halomonas sp.]|uniref:type IV pilus modification protein PilV n=1 Tax=Halomonas sp. TaxID=1486246 RepID=UPI002870900C|nr:type IV pilus modification protein PilV [Halomonas sp.]MDR9439818.1 type IV pilus modification protein PilV [Halomonas sp.]
MTFRPSSQRGFTLIEALIALLVLSIGLLGVAAMQLKALQGAHVAYQRSIASLAAQDLQERLWAKMAEADDLTCPTSTDVTTIESAWHDGWVAYLPALDSAPVGTVVDCEFPITVSWDEGRFSGEGSPEFTYTVRLPEE